MRAGITAIGHCVPPDVFANEWFEQRLDTTDAWIRSRTGIAERRFAQKGATSDLALGAARDTGRIERARVDRSGRIDRAARPDHDRAR